MSTHCQATERSSTAEPTTGPVTQSGERVKRPLRVVASGRRSEAMSELRSRQTDVDVVVIGGGVNGTGVARDCALRGIKVALFERNDLAFGASGNSSGMIHGGPRYLTYDPDVTYTSCLDSGHIQKVAPHLLFRIPFLFPVAKTKVGSRVALDGYDAFFDLYDKYQPLKRGKPHARLTGEEIHRLEPGLVGEMEGGVSFDEWGIDGARLCVGNAVDTEEHGGAVHTHTTVTEILRDEKGRANGVRYRNRLSGETGRVSAKIVVNATGAWAPITATLGKLESKAARVRPGKGIHVFFDRRLTNYAVVCKAIDGRQVFLEPWQNMSVIGTTDDDYYGDLDDCIATSDEVRYLVQAVAKVFPAIREARAIGTWAGVRPTLYQWGPSEDALSREHEIIDHSKHGCENLYSMVGGKLASYRIFAEEMANILAKRLSKSQGCQTHELALPGGDEEIDPLQLATRNDIDPMVAARLEYRHGSRSLRIVERMKKNPQEATVVCPCEPVTEAEIRYVVAEEKAMDIDDVSRRTRLGLGVCGGMRCAGHCGRILAEMTDRSPKEGQRLACDYLELAARRRIGALGPEQARQEALLLAAQQAELGGGA